MTFRYPAWRTGVAIALVSAAAINVASAAHSDSAAQPPQQDSCNLSAAGRIVAVGDVHGAFDRYTAILRETKLLDARLRWIGGNATLVQVGDMIDRGDDSRKVLDLIRRLETEAAKAAGQVRLVLGNHEVMRMAGVWKYVSKADYKSFRASQTDTAQMAALFSESGDYGQWLRQHDVVARINGIAFVHAGPGRAFADRGCAGLNADARAELKSLNLQDPDLEKKLLWSPDGPLWYRGFAGVEPVASSGDVTAVLKALDASRMVIGHTATTPGRIRAYYEGRILAIDSGMLGGEFFPEGVASALEIDKDKFTAVYIGKREVLITLRATPQSD